MDKNDYIYGIRPVMEAIEAGKDIDKVLVKKDLSGDLINELYELVKRYRILIQRVPLEKINRITRKNHQGVLAVLSSVTYSNISNVMPEIYENGRMPFLVALDGITDVRNFGAIARTCECAGVDAVVIPERHSVSVSGDAMKTSAGALNYTPVAKVTNIGKTIEELKKEGLGFVCADMDGTTMYNLDLKGPIGLVVGNEGDGVSRLVKEKCDFVASIPMKGDIDSLNASVATGVLAYEIVRQRLL